jgi:uncharacterized protein DUF3857/transglutaminase superfamily protein
MNCRAKILGAVLPLAILAGPLAGGPALAQVDRTASVRVPDSTAKALDTSNMPCTVTLEGRLTVRPDRSAISTTTKRFKILAPGAITAVSQQQEVYDQSMETLETVEAYTEKADGTKVPVSPANIITGDAATGLQSTFARDLKQRTIVFQDVQVGDTLVLTQRKRMKRGVFENQFFDADVFVRNLPLVSAKMVIEAPTTLDLQVKAIGSSLSDKVEDVGDMRRHTVRYVANTFALPEARSVAPIDVDPMLLVSTFKSYAELGNAYGAAALPKAAVTPEISALAEEITKGIKDRREQAIAIDAWMKKNIRYVAIYLAAGRVVPHDAATVLQNKFGDCKDKVTLMSALLAAKGIASEHVLINFGNAYTLPEPPTMLALNHAILYVPEFGVYDDPTANFAAFGVLSPENYDKPVVRVSGSGVTVARTPAMQEKDHIAAARTNLAIAADGTVTGRTVEVNTGVFGIALRAMGSSVENAGGENAARLQLQAFNTPGVGRFELSGLNKVNDAAITVASFTLATKFVAPPSGGRAFIPFGLPLTARPGNFLLGAVQGNRTLAFSCYAGHQIEDIEAIFAEPQPMPVAPPPTTIDNATFSYRATFKVEGRTFKMHREFVSHVDSQVCQPALEQQIAKDMSAVAGNLNMAYVFQRPASADAPAPAPVAKVAPPAEQNVRPTPVSAPPAPAPVAPAPVTPPPVAKTAPPAEASVRPTPVSATKPVTATQNTVEINRAAVSGQRMRLDFLYSINPDCTSNGFATVRVNEQPRHGRLTFENGTGFTTFLPSNPRVECNKQSSSGVVVTYEADIGYTGPDSFDFDTIFPTGSVSKRHYAVTVR